MCGGFCPLTARVIKGQTQTRIIIVIINKSRLQFAFCGIQINSVLIWIKSTEEKEYLLNFFLTYLTWNALNLKYLLGVKSDDQFIRAQKNAQIKNVG